LETFPFTVQYLQCKVLANIREIHGLGVGLGVGSGLVPSYYTVSVITKISTEYVQYMGNWTVKGKGCAINCLFGQANLFKLFSSQ